jgi:hypothetical protein
VDFGGSSVRGPTSTVLPLGFALTASSTLAVPFAFLQSTFSIDCAACRLTLLLLFSGIFFFGFVSTALIEPSPACVNLPPFMSYCRSPLEYFVSPPFELGTIVPTASATVLPTTSAHRSLI